MGSGRKTYEIDCNKEEKEEEEEEEEKEHTNKQAKLIKHSQYVHEAG